MQRLTGRVAAPAVARRVVAPAAVVAVAFTAVLLAVAPRYGYHRDELYFLVLGRHPAFGYVDQPPLVPLLARGLDVLGDGSLFWLRVPAAVSGGLVVLLTAAIAREFGASRGAQTLAAILMAISSVTMAVSHTTSTSVFDLLGWTLLCWLIVRALRDGGRTWLLVGLVAGVALQVKTLPVFLLFAVLLGVLVVGPRDALRSPWLYGGAAIAAALWAPNLIWQATHGWPQLQLSRAIAAGDSTSSQPRWAFLPFQGLLTGPPLVAVWIAGLVRLWRDPALRTWRGFALVWPVLVVVFVATGGKPYYLGGIYPLLFAAGAAPTLTWIGSVRWRQVVVGVAFTVSLLISATITLPLVPVADLHDTPVLALNPDAGEQVGWPRLAATMRRAYLDAGPHTTVLAHNYGEAGAIARYAAGVPVHSGQNSLWDLGPPPEDASTAVVIGYDRAELTRWFRTVREVARVDDGVDLDNEEQDEVIYRCTGLRTPWRELWPALRRLG